MTQPLLDHCITQSRAAKKELADGVSQLKTTWSVPMTVVATPMSPPIAIN